MFGREGPWHVIIGRTTNVTEERESWNGAKSLLEKWEKLRIQHISNTLNKKEN